MLPGIRATIELTVLQFPIADFIHPLEKKTRLIALQQRIPAPPPNHFNHVPASAAEHALELLNNFTVAANRPIQSLQVTVNDKVKVTQALAPSEANRTQGLGLIAFTITKKTPDLSIPMVHQATLLLILHDVRLVDGLQRSQPHRNCWELPIVRH